MIKNLIKKLFPEKFRLDFRFFLFKLRSIFYTGHMFYCNCCDKWFGKFVTYGNIPRKNAACPYCNSLERTRLLMYYLEKETLLFITPLKILHFAPERFIEKKIKESVSGKYYIPADINPAFAEHEIDITHIPYENNFFDLIICSHVLGHVSDEKRAINEMYRVLNPGGYAIILTVLNLNRKKTYENNEVITEKERLEHYGEPDLVRLHGLDFIYRLERSNIRVEKIDYSKQIPEDLRKKMNVGNNKERELIYKCTKQV